MSNRYSRRHVIKKGLGSLASLTILGLAGCQAANTSGPESMSVALHLIFWGSTTRNKLTEQAINLFQKSHPGTTIASQYSGFDTYWTLLNRLIAAGKTPDLIQMDMRYLSQYVRKGLLLDLTQLIYNQTIDLSDYNPLLLTSSKANNTVYGIPMGGNYQCMHYDKVFLENAGAGPLPENMTWSTFAEYTTELSKALRYKVYGTSDNSGDITSFEMWIRMRGKELYTHDGNLDFELADVVDWYSYWSNLRKANGCLPTSVQINLDNSNTPSDASIIKGKAVFNTLYSNTYEAYQNATPHQLGMTMIPRGSAPGLYLKASMLMSIAAQTKYPTEAASFISSINNDADTVMALGLERGIPGSIQARLLLNSRLTSTQQIMATYVDSVAKSGYTRVKEVLDPPGAGQVSVLLKQVSRDIGFGRTSAIDGAKMFYADAQKILEL